MSLQPFRLDTLSALDGGKAVVAFDQHTRRATQDIADRPGDKSPRKVTLTITLTPVLQADGLCNEVDAQIEVSSTVPKHRTKPYSFGLNHNGMLIFNADSPDNVNQSTFDMDEDRS